MNILTMRRLTFSTAILLGVGLGAGPVGCKTVVVERVVEKEPARRPEQRPEPRPEGPKGWYVTVDQIGWEVVPPEPIDRAFKANTLGWQKHQKGDWAGSRPYFQEAVDIVSEYDLARYNLACAHSRLNDLDAAMAELTHVLVRDLPRFKRKSLSDQDLGNLRRSELGTELTRRIELLEKLWADAMQIGAPTLAWRERGESYIGDAQHSQGQLIRPGVWLHKAKRFVPALEIIDEAFSGYVDVERQQGVLIVAKPTVDSPPLLEGAQVMVAPLEGAGEGLRKADVVFDNLATVEVTALAGGVRVRTNTTKSAWRELKAGGLMRSENQLVPDRPVLRVTPDGSMLIQYWQDGVTFKNRSLFLGSREIVMQPGHTRANTHSLIKDANSQMAVVVAVRAKCSDDGSELHHWIDRIDLQSGTSEGLSNEEGAAAAQFARDGGLYLQIGRETIRYPSPTATTFDALPEGVLLAPPMSRPTCE